METLSRDSIVARTLDLAAGMPLPGGGATRQRFARLHAIAAVDPSLGRLAEAHTDALAILVEAGRPKPLHDGLLGVWAARGAVAPASLVRDHDGWRLTGSVPWCSGAGLVDGALVAAALGGRDALVLVDLHAAGITIGSADWVSPAFVDTETRTVDFDVGLAHEMVIGVDGWYVARPGFWHGAVGVAACWAGCVAGLVNRVRPLWRADPHALAHLGAVDALLWQMRAALDTAAAEIDVSPADDAAAHVRALRVRHCVDVSVGEVTTRVQRALGPAPLAMTPDIHRIIACCDLYRRQCHAERDLEALGRLSGGATSPDD